MKLAIIGATGKAGSEMLEKALEQNIKTTAIVRSPEKLTKDVPYIEKDAGEIVSADLDPFDVVINALGFDPENADLISRFGERILESANQNQRLIYVGHAGTLLKDSDSTEPMYKGDSFPSDFKPVAENHYKNLEKLKKAAIPWTMMCPASMFDPDGKESGQIKTNADIRVKNDEGKSYISYKDFASAVITEVLEKNYLNKHVSTVGEKVE